VMLYAAPEGAVFLYLMRAEGRPAGHRIEECHFAEYNMDGQTSAVVSVPSGQPLYIRETVSNSPRCHFGWTGWISADEVRLSAPFRTSN
jgi:hypothetical protein